MKNRSLKRIVTPIAIAALLTLGAFHAPRAAELDPALQAALENGGEIAFIAKFADQLDLSTFPGRGRGRGINLAALLWALRDLAQNSQSTAVALLQAGGAKQLVQLWSINALAATADADVIMQLATLPEIASIVLDATIEAPVIEQAGGSPAEWNLNMVKAPQLWANGSTGSGVVVAAMDTGVDGNHPDLANSWRGNSNSWFDPNGEHATPYDYSGHGTAVMAVMVGGDNGGSAIGMAPAAKWIGVKIFNDGGKAQQSAIHQGFQWLLDPDGNPGTQDQPDVVNNSWGYPQLAGQCYTEFQRDIELLKAIGIAVVFSAGNQGPSAYTSESLANNPEGFGIGAVDSDGQIAYFSSRGPSACDGSFYPDVVAPGVNVRTAYLTNTYISVDGTSIAAPHVSGAIALLRDLFPDISVSELELSLEYSAVDLGADGADYESGYGLIDVGAAAELLTNTPNSLCTDFDGDGFVFEAFCGTPLDCNDDDATTNPAACDIKGDGIDQNCDGEDRTKGKPCPAGGNDGGGGDTPTGTEGKGQTCSDGLDNDDDGFFDCGDPGCSKNKACK